MARSIPPVQNTNSIRHCILIDLNLDGTQYYISSAYNEIIYNSNTYTQLGAFLSLGQIAEDIKTTNGDINIGLSGVPDAYVSAVLDNPIKGGEVVVYRAFFNEDYTVDSGNIFQRFKGLITNYTLEENIDILEGEHTNTIQITCASINTILENKVSGQRTAPADRRKFFAGDETFDRVPDLQGVQFDFGREYNPGAGSGGGGFVGPIGGGGGGGGGLSFGGGVRVNLR
jgi:uncharacterized membrane protein YgcG